MIRSVGLRNIRVYKEGEIEFPSGISVLFGGNGEGKTTVLEALSFLATSKSFRTSTIQDLIRFGAEQGRIEASLENSDLRAQIHPTSRLLFRDGKKATALALSAGWAVVVLAPEHREMIFGRSEMRRDYLDRILFGLEPAYLKLAQNYRRALTHKRALLGKNLPFSIFADHVAPWNETLSAAGEEIRSRRSALVDRLLPGISAWYRKIAPAAGDATLVYRSKETNIREALSEKTHLEHATGRALVGPHRDDLEIQLHGRLARDVVSQGESSSILLALKLTELEIVETTGVSPVLLFDDLGATLDAPRRERLFDALANAPHQAIFTTAEQGVADTARKLGATLLRRTEETDRVRWV